jgi:hypothetical protein
LLKIKLLQLKTIRFMLELSFIRIEYPRENNIPKTTKKRPIVNMLSTNCTTSIEIKQVINHDIPSVMVGIGLGSGSRRTLSNGVPIDLINFLAKADDFRQESDYLKGIIFIADNPRMYPYENPEIVENQAELLNQLILMILPRLKLENWVIVRGTSFYKMSHYRSLMDTLNPLVKELMGKKDTNCDQVKMDYFLGQVCDVEYLRLFFSVRAKFGWASDEIDGEITFDEFYNAVIAAAHKLTPLDFQIFSNGKVQNSLSYS